MIWNVGKIMTKRAMATPDKVAVFFENESITYGQLNDKINQVANCMQAKGLKKGDRISVSLLNCPEFLAVYFAAAKLGLIFVPLNFRMVAGELKYQLNDCGSRLLVFNDMFIKNIEPIRSSIKVDADKYIFLKSGLPGFQDCPEWAVDYHEMLKNASTAEPILEDPVKIDDPLGIIYTSGTTGDPKGAVLSHEQTYFKNFQISDYTDMRKDDIFLSQLPLFHSGGLYIVVTPTLCSGATIVMRRTFEPDQFARDIEKFKATIVFGLTTMWRFILNSKALDDTDVSTVRAVLGGGERTPATLLKELSDKGLNMQLGFGQTENSAMMMTPKHAIIKKAGSIGLPGFFTEIWIQDSEGNRLPPDEIGEIVAIGPTVMSGYWNMPDKTSETIIDGILHTGDLGYIDKDGYFYIVDRAKDMYRTGGENVYPAEVEKVLADHPNIENVAIVGIPDDKWGETGKAYITCVKNETITLEQVKEYLDGKVARYKFPGQIEIIEALPLTSTGKIRKVALKERFLDK